VAPDQVDEPPALRIGVRFAAAGDPGELFADARAVEAAGADSLWADAADGDPYVLLAALAAVTWRAALVASGAPNGSGRATCAHLARGRLLIAEESSRRGERWIQLPFPNGRDEWRAAREAAAKEGATGIVVANDPRLLDLLRNPDQIADRADMNLASG
jgi:alkanesulfonate monooxygenase SsuD/methylene tetrahydromethanopterin reductase-like flavin-dependent oxidoreductase (luciferase family)